MEVSLCFAFSELSFNWSPRALRLFLWRQIHDRVSYSVRKSNALAWCCPGALPSCGVFIYAQWTRTEALPWWWWQIRLWRVLEQSGAVLWVLPSRDGTGVWCKVIEILWTLLCDISTVKVISYRGILVYNICLISISNSVSDGATNKSVLNIENS